MYYFEHKNYKNIPSNSYIIPECRGKRFVISDIHGCLDTFKTLFEKINLTIDDQLFFLGDYVDRGPNSKGVVDFIIDLQNSEYQIYPLRGNHEEDLLFINSYKNERLLEIYTDIDTKGFFRGNQMIFRYKKFFKELPYFIELDNFILVHAGFDTRLKAPFSDLEEMLWIRNFEYKADVFSNKTIIHGHTPFVFDKIIEKINNREKIIPLDNGAVFKGEEGYANLLCLNIDNYELIVQPNIEV